MKLVENNQPGIGQFRIVLEFAGENGLGNDLDLGIRPHPVVKTDPVPYPLTDLFI